MVNLSLDHMDADHRISYTDPVPLLSITDGASYGSATVTYSNLKHWNYNGKRIAKVIYELKLISSVPTIEGVRVSTVLSKPSIALSNDPTKGFEIFGAQVDIKATYLYDDDTPVNFVPGTAYLAPGSLNYYSLPVNYRIETTTINHGGIAWKLDGSTIIVHENKDGSASLYADTPNTRDRLDPAWDYNGSPYQYYGAGLIELRGDSLSFSVSTKYDGVPQGYTYQDQMWWNANALIPPSPTTKVNYHFTTTINPCKIALIFEKEAIYMQKITSDSKFVDYYRYWVELYKVGSVRQVTLDGYWLVLQHLQQLIPDLQLKDLNHRTYQALINDFAQTHERKTVKGFHTRLKAALVDGLDEGIIAHDPTRHLVLKGKDPKPKKIKYLSMLELKLLIHEFDLNEQEINFDWLLFLISKTGLRIAEAIGLTRQDFDFTNGTLSINKTWNYRSPQGGFQPTKNKSSNRVIAIDPILTKQFEQLTKNIENTQPIFVPAGKRFYVSSINNRLQRHCKNAGVPVISVHGLRHTHASLLMYDGVSIPSVAQRLGHASTLTTQSTYLHIVKELESLDNHKIMENMIRLS